MRKRRRRNCEDLIFFCVCAFTMFCAVGWWVLPTPLQTKYSRAVVKKVPVEKKVSVDLLTHCFFGHAFRSLLFSFFSFFFILPTQRTCLRERYVLKVLFIFLSAYHFRSFLFTISDHHPCVIVITYRYSVAYIPSSSPHSQVFNKTRRSKSNYAPHLLRWCRLYLYI